MNSKWEKRRGKWFGWISYLWIVHQSSPPEDQVVMNVLSWLVCHLDNTCQIALFPLKCQDLDECFIFCFYRFIFFYTKRWLLLWKSTVFIARESFLAFMRMWGYYAILTTFLLVFTCGMKSPQTSFFVFGFINVSC